MYTICMKIITKLNVLVLSLVGLVIAFFLYKTSPEQFANGNCWNVLMKCTKFKWVFALSVLAPVAVFSLVTFKMKNEIFKPWAWFSIIFSGIYIYSGVTDNLHRDGFSPGLVFESKINFIIYTIVSIIIILTQLYRIRKK